MSEVIPFPRPHKDNGRRIIVAIDDELFPMLATPSFEASGYEVRYVPASSLADPSVEADLWLGKYEPSAPGRALLLQTASGATYEIDEERRVWRSGELVWTEPLADFGVADTGERGIIRMGHQAGFLFLSKTDGGWHLRIRVTSPVVLVGRFPDLLRTPVPSGWLALARRITRGDD